MDSKILVPDNVSVVLFLSFNGDDTRERLDREVKGLCSQVARLSLSYVNIEYESESALFYVCKVLLTTH